MNQSRLVAIVLLVSLVLIACNNYSSQLTPTITAKTIMQGKDVNYFRPKVANYLPLYIGKNMRRIDLVSNFKLDTNSTIVHGLNIICNLTNQQLKIFVDTSQILDSPITDIHFTKSGKIEEVNAISYPVILKNLTNENIKIGFCEDIYLEMEVYLQGKWSGIERAGRFYNDVCVKSLALPANQIALTTVPIYSGEIGCPARLKLGNIYSNIFSTNINTEQIFTYK